MSNYAPPGLQPTAYSQPGYPPPPQPSGCGCGGCLGKFFLLLGVLFFLLIVLCGGAVYFGYQSLNKSISRQPAAIQAVQEEIASLQVPPQLKPVAGGHVNILGTDLGEGVVYSAADGKCAMIVARPAGNQVPQNLLVLSLIWAEKQQHPTANMDLMEDLREVKTNSMARTIGGQEATFEISQGVGVKSGKKKIQVQGTFQGKSGSTLLIISAEEDTLSRKQIDEIIKSIGGDVKAEKQ
jgi:hypothetical protein